MPPQIKQDLNRSGWETTDFPSVCESCLPENPFVQMLKNDFGAECKLCTRPFTVFTWKADRTSRTRRTNICLTCARLKNCCQCCMLDLSFGLPIVVRDAALKMVAPGVQSSINREYYAQEHEKEIEEGRGAVETYEKTDEKARELLRRLANSEPYHKRQRRLESAGGAESSSALSSTQPFTQPKQIGYGSGPMRTQSSRASRRSNPAARPRVPFSTPSPASIAPPADTHITSLFVTGVEEDLPEHALRSFFTPFGKLRSVVCSHRAHCAFINFATREAAEKAAAECQGKAIVQGVPLRIQWGKPRPLDSMENEERSKYRGEGRRTIQAIKQAEAFTNSGEDQKAITEGEGTVQLNRHSLTVAPPPGQEDVPYASMRGE